MGVFVICPVPETTLPPTTTRETTLPQTTTWGTTSPPTTTQETTLPPITTQQTTLPPTTTQETTLPPTTTPETTLKSTTQTVTTLPPTTEAVTTSPPTSQQETTLPLTTQPTVAPTTAKSTPVPIEVVPFREEFILEEEIIEVISNLSPEEKSKIGFDTNIVLDCQFAGAACYARFILQTILRLKSY